MKWSERLQTEIKVGQIYLDRSGTKMQVIDKIDDTHFRIKRTPPPPGYVYFYNHRREHVVNQYGGFGNYPNPYDLTTLQTTETVQP